MSSSHLFKTSDPRITNIMRQYSDYFNLKPNNLEAFPMSQSSHPQMHHLGKPNDLLSNEQHRKSSQVRSLIEQLIKKQNHASPNLGYINPARPVLVNAQQRIFQQVINLLMEINEIKENIQKEKELTLQMEVERDSILNKGDDGKGKNRRPNDLEMESIINRLKNKEGSDIKISLAELQKFSTDNQQLEKNINRLRIKSKGNLQQVLEEQRQKFRNLQRRLQQKNNQNSQQSNFSGTNPQILQQIKRLQGDIQRLQSSVQDGSNIGYEIKRLNEENQRLKEKTLLLINQSGQGSTQNLQQAEERRRLQQYIRQEEENKALFFDDLKRFKQEYLSLKAENDELKRRVKGGYQGRSEGFSKNGFSGEGSKFMKYEDLMSEMNTVMK